MRLSRIKILLENPLKPASVHPSLILGQGEMWPVIAISHNLLTSVVIPDDCLQCVDVNLKELERVINDVVKCLKRKLLDRLMKQSCSTLTWEIH